MKHVLYLIGWLFLLTLIFAPSIRAHEVYVLNEREIVEAMASSQPLHFFEVIKRNGWQFFAAGFAGVLLVSFVFIISISKTLESWADPFLFRIKHFAPVITQLTLAIALFASGYYQAFFGIELPMSQFGPFANFFRLMAIMASLLIATGIFTRLGALFVLFIFATLAYQHGIYMSNYLVYLGEALALTLFGSAYTFFPQFEIQMPKWVNKLKRFKFPLMRLFFGLSLIYAAVYAKYLHGMLALETIEKYNLQQFFPFEPLFIVLGAFIVECLIGLFFLLGIEIRFTSIFYSIFLILSVLFFQESVWPHLVLMGTALSMAIHGYDRFTLEGYFFGDSKHEPVF